MCIGHTKFTFTLSKAYWHKKHSFGKIDNCPKNHKHKHKVGMRSPKKDQLKPLGRFNSKLYTKSNYIGVRARTPCTFWDNCQFCQNCVFCVNKLWIKWKWTLYDQYTLKGHELNLYCIKKLPAYELVRRALLSRAILTCIRGGGQVFQSWDSVGGGGEWIIFPLLPITETFF